MNLHEYQAKALFKSYGMPVPESIVAKTADEVADAMGKLSTPKVVVKAQVHAGCLLYTSPSPRDATLSRMPSSA